MSFKSSPGGRGTMRVVVSMGTGLENRESMARNFFWAVENFRISLDITAPENNEAAAPPLKGWRRT
jgi:hypothetical protein